MKKLISCFCLFFTLTTIGVFAQQMTLDEVIKNAARDLEEALPQGTMIAVLNFASPSPAFSEFVIEELTGELVNGRKLTIVDRSSLSLIREELNLQLSGDVSDESAQAIGKMLGAQSIVSGSLANVGTYQRFRIRVISVETAAIQTQVSLNLQNDAQVAFLLGDNAINAVPPSQQGSTGNNQSGSAQDDTSNEPWKNNWLYLGFRAGGSPTLPAIMEAPQNFGAAFSVTGQLTEAFGIQTELVFSFVKPIFGLSYSINNGPVESTSYPVPLVKIMVPLLTRITIRPQNFSFGAALGVNFAFLIGTTYTYAELPSMRAWETITHKSPGIGIMAVLNFGYHLGPGILFFDIRGHYDFIEPVYQVERTTRFGTTYSDPRTYEDSWQGGFMTFSIGYEIGLLPKARR